MSSGRLFRSDCLSAFMMRSFSVRHRSHLFDSLVYGCAWLAMDHLMVWGVLFRFRLQMNLDSSVLFWYLSCRKDWRWLLYLNLNGGSVRPI